jgi:hypothetical protein
MISIVRLLLMIAAPITALFVARDALNFGVLQTFVVTLLVAGFVALAAAWRLRRGTEDP